jgi:hypothetical protein
MEIFLLILKDLITKSKNQISNLQAWIDETLEFIVVWDFDLFCNFIYFNAMNYLF